MFLSSHDVQEQGNIHLVQLGWGNINYAISSACQFKICQYCTNVYDTVMFYRTTAVTIVNFCRDTGHFCDEFTIKYTIP